MAWVTKTDLIDSRLKPSIEENNPELIKGAIGLIVELDGLTLAGILTFVWAGFDLYSYYYIKDRPLIVKTLLRKRTFPFEEIQEVGIYLDKYRQVWIYFSKEELDQAGWKRVNRRGLSKFL